MPLRDKHRDETQRDTINRLSVYEEQLGGFKYAAEMDYAAKVPRVHARLVWNRDDGHSVESFFVSSRPNMMSFTASLSNRFGARQNRSDGWR